MKRLLTICAVVGLIMAVTGTAQAQLDIDTIIMTSCKNYVNGTPSEPNLWRFEIWIDLAATGDLHHIDVTLPTGGLSDFTIYDSYWEYDSNNYSSLAALQGDYPTGDYLFSFEDSNNLALRSFTLDYIGLSEPCSPVHFTSPTHLATDVPLDPTFEWTVDSGDGDALYMWLDSDDDWYENGPVSITTSWTPGPLDPNYDYSLEVSVINVKGLLEGPAFPTMNPSGTDLFKYGLWIEHLNEIEFTTIPEPATIALLGLGSLALLRRKRKA